MRLKSDPQQGFQWLALLAFPWFCWFPLVVTFGTMALHTLLARVSPLGWPVWLQTGLVTLGLAAVSGALWGRGRWLEARARNPFQGGVLGAALGARR